MSEEIDFRQAVLERGAELPLADRKSYMAGRLKARLVHFFSPSERRLLEARVGLALGRAVAPSERRRIIQAYFLYRATAALDVRFRRDAEFTGPAAEASPSCLWLTLMSPFSAHILGYPQGWQGRLHAVPAPPDLPALFESRIEDAIKRAGDWFEGRMGVVTYKRLSPAREQFELRKLTADEASPDRLRTLFTDLFHLNPAVYDWHCSLRYGRQGTS